MDGHGFLDGFLFFFEGGGELGMFGLLGFIWGIEYMGGGLMGK